MCENQDETLMEQYCQLMGLAEQESQKAVEYHRDFYDPLDPNNEAVFQKLKTRAKETFVEAITFAKTHADALIAEQSQELDGLNNLIDPDDIDWNTGIVEVGISEALAN